MARINIEIDEEIHKKAKLAALLEEMSLKDFINNALEEKIAREAGKISRMTNRLEQSK